MNAVVYFSRTGNTMKVAQAIADAVKSQAISIAEFNQQDSINLLFIGGAIYGAKLDPSLVQFIQSLDRAKIGRAVVFSTYFVGETAIAMIKSELKNRGIAVNDESFCCHGKFLFMKRKHPTNEELEKAKKFAASVLATKSILGLRSF